MPSAVGSNGPWVPSLVVDFEEHRIGRVAQAYRAIATGKTVGLRANPGSENSGDPVVSLNGGGTAGNDEKCASLDNGVGCKLVVHGAGDPEVAEVLVNGLRV